MLKIFKCDLCLFAAITCLVIVCAIGWGGPFISSAAGVLHTQMHSAYIFQGDVIRQGEQFLLRDSSGEEFRLDGAQQPERFIGRTVIVKGNLEDTSNSIHIVQIEPAA
jgi:hypothetical protein